MIEIPEFRSAFLLGGGHRQTLAAVYLRGSGPGRSGIQHTITMPDGDELVIHDDCPRSWGPCAPVVLLMHGLGGSHQSAYMVRIMNKLNARGVRTFRLDHRGCGACESQARFPYHAGRSDDVFEAIYKIKQLCPGSLIGAAGFSLSANILLKLLGEESHRDILPKELSCAVSVNPPLDLLRCNVALDLPSNRLYQNHFVKFLWKQVEDRIQRYPDAPRPRFTSPPPRLRVFDDQYTAPASGFRDVLDYYESCSGKHFVSQIGLPTLILTSRDDPLIPAESFEELDAPANVLIHITEGGGHMGYIGRRGLDPDRRWMDWRVIDWLTAHLRP
jgi:predicted alpha/beta-fold hydrolase